MAKKRSSFWEYEGKLEPSLGSNISDVIPEAINLAKNGPFSFEFNGVTVIVKSDSDPALIYRDWSRAMSGYIEGPIGPYPAAELTDAEQSHDRDVEAANEARRQKSQDEYDAKMRARKAAADAKLSGVTLDLLSPDVWQSWKDAQNGDGYGLGVFTFAERWAKLMQVEMAQGAKLADIADRLVSEADTEGITGFMYGCAVSALAKCWLHGEELRRWHNIETQIKDEGARANESGGVLNPALLNIG